MKIFDKRIYFEGLKQIRLAGFILFSIVFIVSLLFPLGYKFSGPDQVELLKLQIAPVLLPFILVGPFVFTLNLFNFLNRRNQIDFYNSLPVKRHTLFTSYYAAILSWETGIIAITLFSCAGLYAVAGASFDYSQIPLMLFYNLAGTFLVTACIALAMSLTGTLLNNFLVSLLILFFPRFLMSIFSFSITGFFSSFYGYVSFVPVSELGIIGDYRLNIPVNLLFGLYNSDDSNLFIFSPFIYSLVLFLIISTFALIVFIKRKSEDAEKSAPNKWLQHVFRCVFSSPIALFMILVLFYEHNEVIGIMFYIITVVSTLVLYFTYELITTKKIKNLVKAIPVLGILVAFIFAFGITLEITKNNFIQFKPQAEEIEWIKADLEADASYEFRYLKDFVKYNASEVKIVSPELNQLVSKSVADIISNIQNGIYGSDGIDIVKLEIKTRGRSPQSRTFCLNRNGEIMSLILQNNDMQKALMQLPDEKKIIDFDMGPLNREDSLRVWRLFKEEYANLDIKQMANINYFLTNKLNGNHEDEKTIKGFYVFRTYKSNEFYDVYRLTELTPKSAALYVQLVNQINLKRKEEKLTFVNIYNGKKVLYTGNASKVQKVISLAKEAVVFDNSLYLTEFFTNSGESFHLYVNIDKEKMKDFRKTLKIRS